MFGINYPGFTGVVPASLSGIDNGVHASFRRDNKSGWQYEAKRAKISRNSAACCGGGERR